MAQGAHRIVFPLCIDQHLTCNPVCMKVNIVKQFLDETGMLVSNIVTEKIQRLNTSLRNVLNMCLHVFCLKKPVCKMGERAF